MVETPKEQQKQRRARRLSTALRDNLKRRKAQLRGRAGAVAEHPAEHDSAGFVEDKRRN